MSEPNYDSYLAGYRRQTVEVWCRNKECDNHSGPTTVTYEEEYGAGWTTPEECDRCGGEWTFDAPDEEDEDDDED